MNNKKPLFIALGAVAGVFLIAAMIALFSGIAKKDNNTNKSAAGEPYPYSWTEKKNGEIALTLTGKGVENGVWSCVSASVVTVDEGKNKGDRTVFTLTPAEPGRETVTFLLSGSDGLLADASFTVEVVSGADEKLSAAISSHVERLLQGTLTGGTDGQYPFTVTSENGTLILTVADPALADAFPEDDEERPERGETEPEEEPTETEEESDTQAGGVLPDSEPVWGPSEPKKNEEPSGSETPEDESPEDEETSAFSADNWRIATSDNLVAMPVLVSIGEDGLTYRIESDVNGDAMVTVSNSYAKVVYQFSVSARHGALTVLGYKVFSEIPAQSGVEDESSYIIDNLPDLEPYESSYEPRPEESEGEQDDGRGMEEQDADYEESGESRNDNS